MKFVKPTDPLRLCAVHKCTGLPSASASGQQAPASRAALWAGFRLFWAGATSEAKPLPQGCKLAAGMPAGVFSCQRPHSASVRDSTISALFKSRDPLACAAPVLWRVRSESSARISSTTLSSPRRVRVRLRLRAHATTTVHVAGLILDLVVEREGSAVFEDVEIEPRGELRRRPVPGLRCLAAFVRTPQIVPSRPSAPRLTDKSPILELNAGFSSHVIARQVHTGPRARRTDAPCTSFILPHATIGQLAARSRQSVFRLGRSVFYFAVYVLPNHRPAEQPRHAKNARSHAARDRKLGRLYGQSYGLEGAY